MDVTSSGGLLRTVFKLFELGRYHHYHHRGQPHYHQNHHLHETVDGLAVKQVSQFYLWVESLGEVGAAGCFGRLLKDL